MQAVFITFELRKTEQARKIFYLLFQRIALFPITLKSKQLHFTKFGNNSETGCIITAFQHKAGGKTLGFAPGLILLQSYGVK